MNKAKMIIKKILIFLLMILPLTMSFVVPIKSIAVAATTIDLNTYNEASVNAPVHTHIWSTKFNDTKHWEECSICNSKRNEQNHSLTGNGGSKTLC